MGIPDWRSVNSTYRSSRGSGNAQTLGFNQTMSASLFGATTDQEGMSQSIFGPATIVSGEEFGNGVANLQIKALQAKLQESYTGANPFASSSSDDDDLDSLLAKLSGSSTTSPSGYEASRFGALSSEFYGGSASSSSSKPSDATRFGSVGYAVTGNGTIVDLSV